MGEDRTVPPLDRRTVLRLGGVGALAAGAALSVVTETHAAPDQRLDGAWRTTFTRTRPAANPTPNRRILTCTADGIALLGGPPATAGTNGIVYRDLGQGEWRRMGDRRFAIGVLIGNFGADGAPLFETFLAIEVTLLHALDSFAGTYHSDDVAPDGSVSAARDGEIVAERIVLPA